jgi:SpoVK/Ycf46/Vps4 family AAA+-type ATPase
VNSIGDSGTATRVFGTFLTWMQEKTKPVFVVATANQVEALPSEFMRKGRFDEIFFVDLPTHLERLEIFRVHMEKRLRDPSVVGNLVLNDTLYERLAQMSEGFSGAEIEQVVIAGLFEAFSEDRSVSAHDFERALRNTVPLSVTQAEQILAVRSWANLRAVAASAAKDLAGYGQIGTEQSTAAVPAVEPDVRDKRGGRMVDV